MLKKPIKAKKAKSLSDKRLNLPDDEPVKINMPFEDAIKRALNTPIKNRKAKK